MKTIAIIGYSDNLVGQIINFLPSRIKKRIKFLVYNKKLKNSYFIKDQISKKKEMPILNKMYGINIFIKKQIVQFLISQKIKEVFLLLEDKDDRKKIFNELKKKKFKILSYIHPRVIMAGKNKVGEGVIIFPNNYIGYKSDIGNSTIIQSSCSIDHHNIIGNFCDINPNLTTGGFVEIEDSCLINMSVDIINRIKIKKYSRIGAGSLVLKNTISNYLYYGRPAKKIKLLY
jgi:sugar O-acyltransferase (sialic acid O-acetyltransferase NeuD family)